MKDTLSYMIERSRFDVERLAGGMDEAKRPVDPKLVDDAANALFACTYIQVCGTLFARAAAERRAAVLDRAIRDAGLEREVTSRLKSKAANLCGFFHVH